MEPKLKKAGAVAGTKQQPRSAIKELRKRLRADMRLVDRQLQKLERFSRFEELLRRD